MIISVRGLMVTLLLAALSVPVNAATRYTIATEVVIKGQTRSEVAIVTLFGDEGRIDFVERNGRKEENGSCGQGHVREDSEIASVSV